MFFGIPACIFLFVATAGASVFDILSVFICSYSLEASSMIYRDSSCSDNTSILFVLLDLVLVPLCNFYYMCFILDR